MTIVACWLKGNLCLFKYRLLRGKSPMFGKSSKKIGPCLDDVPIGIWNMNE